MKTPGRLRKEVVSEFKRALRDHIPDHRKNKKTTKADMTKRLEHQAQPSGETR